MSKELSNLTDLFAGGALAVQSAEDLAEVEALSQASSFLPRIQLYFKGKPIDKQLIELAHYGVPRSDEDIQDLGKSIDLLVLVRKPKAIDMSDRDNILVTNDVNSSEFKRIVEAADNTRDSGCAYGPTYLVFERSTGKFYEFFCGNKSARFESSKINLYLPVTLAMIEAGLTEEKKPRGPKPMTLTSQYLENSKYSWYAPKAEDCLTPFDRVPTVEQVQTEVDKFLKKEEVEVETVEETKSRRRR